MFFRPLNSKATFISTILLRAMLLVHSAPNWGAAMNFALKWSFTPSCLNKSLGQ
jgi:hypothetical protein